MFTSDVPFSGINGVISAVTLEAIKQDCSVLGFHEGFRWLVEGRSKIQMLDDKSVMGIFDQGEHPSPNYSFT